MDRLLVLARRDPEVARALQDLHVWFGRELATALGPDSHKRDNHVEPPERVVSIDESRRVVRLDHLSDESRERRGVDLERIAERAAAKADVFAEAARMEMGQDALALVAAKVSEHSEELPGGLEAVLSGKRPAPDDAALQTLAACFRNVSLSAEVVLRLRSKGRLDGVPPTALLYLLAEAQSALLSALGALDVHSDSDQHDLFLWLKDQTTRHRIYVDRHMRLDDPADASAHADLTARLASFERDFDKRWAAEDERRRLVGKLRFHCRKVCDNDDFEGRDWEALLAGVEEWLAGEHPSREAVAALAPLRQRMPSEAEVTPGLAQLLEAGRDRAGGDRNAPRADLTERATELLAGRTVVLFGRRERTASKRALEQEFRLAELKWVELDPEAIRSQLESEIDRPEVNMVLIAMRLPGEQYELFKELCLKSQKPFVRLPNGYAPTQVAQQVLRQVGRRLKPLEPAG